MIWKLSEKFTSWFIHNGFLKSEDYDVYVYCIDSLLAKVFFYTILFSLASIFHILDISICYYAGFMPFRYTAGGYHAKSDNACILLTWFVYGLSMSIIIFSTTYIPTIWLMIASLSFIIFALIVALLYAPLDHFHKPVSAEKKLIMRKFCLCFQIIFILIAILLNQQYCYKYAFSIGLGNGLAALLLLIAHYQWRRGLK